MLGHDNPQVRRILQVLARQHKPSFLIIMEPRVMREHADKVIKGLSFDYSHREEANGFTGGIWLLWTNSISMEIWLTVVSLSTLESRAVLESQVSSSWLSMVALNAKDATTYGRLYLNSNRML